MNTWTRKLRMGMVGGGQGAFIGAVHRIAATLDGQAELVAGVFSRDWSNTQTTGTQLYLDPARLYRSYEDMAAAEASLPADRRIDFVVIVTPNNAHYGPAKAFLNAGFHVVCDKPLSFDLAEAESLAQMVERTRLVFALTHNYTGYPLVRHARHLFRSGELGTVRKVIVEYLQDWLVEPEEKRGSKQAMWRTNPAESGAGGAIGDIGTHAFNLTEYVTGDRVSAIAADKSTFLPDRMLDEDINALLRFRGGGKGVLTVSQIATGIFTGGSMTPAAAYGLGYGIQGLNSVLQSALNATNQKFQTEADQLGIQYAWKAGYDPRGFIAFLDSISGTANNNFVSNEPPLQKRLLNSFSEIQYLPLRKESIEDTGEFDRIRSRVR